MKAIEIEGKFILVGRIPNSWNGNNEYQNADPSVHYADGWRDLIIPPYNSNNQELGSIISLNNTITFKIEDLEIDKNKSNIIQNAQSEKQQFIRIKLENQVEAELQALTDDADILENQAGYPLWEVFPDQHPFGANDKVQDFEGNELKMFKIIQPHNKQDDRVPINVPALWTKIEFSGGIEVWAQPIGGDGKYPYIDLNTGLPYRVMHNGLLYENNHPAPNLNVWEPGTVNSTIWEEVL